MPDRDFDGNAEMFRTLGHAVRLQILCAIKEEEHSVGEIEELTGITQPGLSQQLGILRKAELVLTRREGKQVFYIIDRDRVLAASDLLGTLAGRADVPRLERHAARTHSSGGVATFAKVVR